MFALDRAGGCDGECVIMTDGRGSSPPITSEDHSLGSISANRIQTDKLISKDFEIRTGLDDRVTSPSDNDELQFGIPRNPAY